MRIENSSLLITGAGSGLGAATARQLVAAGARVTLFDVDAKAVEMLAAELGERAQSAAGDVTLADDVQRAIDAAGDHFGELRGVVHCAGILGAERVVGKQGPHDLQRFARVVNVNLIGTFNVTRLAAAAMTGNVPNSDGERGVIINTASVAAYEGQIGQAAYAASKAGVVGMTLPIARELAQHGIRVMAIAPGAFETAMIANMKTEVRERLAAEALFPKRLGRPGEFAQLVCAIFENPMLNGSVIRLDGAVRMPPR